MKKLIRYFKYVHETTNWNQIQIMMNGGKQGTDLHMFRDCSWKRFKQIELKENGK